MLTEVTMRTTVQTMALLLLPLIAVCASPSLAFAEANATKAKVLHESAKKSFEEASKEQTALMKHLEDAGSAEARADAKWQEAARLEAEARRFEPKIELKAVQGEGLR